MKPIIVESGAKYTRARRPVILVYCEEFDTKEDAMKREWELKQYNRKQKEKIIEEYNKKASVT